MTFLRIIDEDFQRVKEYDSCLWVDCGGFLSKKIHLQNSVALSLIDLMPRSFWKVKLETKGGVFIILRSAMFWNTFTWLT